MLETMPPEGLGQFPLLLATSPEGLVLYASHALQQLLRHGGAREHDDCCAPIPDWAAAALQDSGLLLRLVSLQAPLAHRCALSLGNGRSIDVQWHSRPVLSPSGTLVCVESVGQVIIDRSARTAACTGPHECTCSRLVQLLQGLELVSDHVAITDIRGYIEYANPAFEIVSGRTREWLIGRHMSEVWSEPTEPPIEAEVAATLMAGKVFRGERVNRNAWGDLFFDDVVFSPVRGLSGEVTHVVAAGRDTTYRHLADPMTGLQSRRLLLDRIERAIARADLSREPRPFALLFIDVDRFKAINDTYGKEVGDHVILELGRRIQRAMPERPAVGRVTHLNRDEFAVLLESVEVEDDACTVAEQILRRVGKPIVVDNSELTVSASIGIAFSSATDHTRPENVLRDAETAMERVKRGGGNGCDVFSPALFAEAVDKTRLGSELRGALDKQELWLCYQPIVSLATGEITGAEALIRWQHPTRGLVPPSEFVSAAEENGLILALGNYVLQEACRQMRQWQELGFGALAVNVSARQLRHPEFLDQVADALRMAGLPGHLLKLELTESTAAHDPEAVTLLLWRLKEMGVEILMDDFGTGYSSLSYLTRFPLDKLKIDRAFVQRAPESAHDASVATTIVAMAHSLGLGVIAEGVETQEQAAFLRRLGCEEMQGYLFSRPLAAPEFEALVRSGRRLDAAVSPSPFPPRVSLESSSVFEASVSGLHAWPTATKKAQ